MKKILNFLKDWFFMLIVIIPMAGLYLMALIYPIYLYIVNPNGLDEWDEWEWTGFGVLWWIFLGGIFGYFFDIFKKK